MSPVLISIITVNYNNIEGLKKTMSSVFAQTWQDFEYIVIDGGSIDGSKAAIEQLQDQLAYWVSEPDSGIYQAMNKGINVAKGDYVLFLNSGDHFYSKTALTYFKPLVSKRDPLDIIYGNLAVISNTIKIKTYPSRLSFAYFAYETLPHPASLIKRNCFHNFLYDEHLKIASDWKFFIVGVCKKKFSYRYINEIISFFYEDGISSNMPQIVKHERQQVLNEEFYWKFKIYQLKQYIVSKFFKS